jgi:DNA-binding NarL/FixJ family response regulator
VAAPIMPAGHVIGFLHADHYVSERCPDEADRDLLFTFAEAFGLMFERLVHARRVHTQGARARALAEDLERTLDGVRGAPVRIVGAEPAPRPHTLRPVPALPGDHDLRESLTARELEVLTLLASGSTNTVIGERLVISEGTVKSHVKQIFRKLGAVNRADAVSRYLRTAAAAGAHAA